MLIAFFYHSQGKLEVSSVTGRLEPKEAPAWQRIAFRYLVSFPIIGLCLALVFAVMFAMLQLQVHTRKNEFKTKSIFHFPPINHSLRLFAYIIIWFCISHFTFTFPCSETLAKLFYRTDPFRPSEQQIPFKHSSIHSFIHTLEKHRSIQVTCIHLSKLVYPFVSVSPFPKYSSDYKQTENGFQLFQRQKRMTNKVICWF